MAGPLSHIRVLDLSRIMAGPWATQVLADLGADVIKVERPGVGDDTRTWGPPFLKDASGKPTKEAGYYLSVNRGKRSITLDLDKPEGQSCVRAMAARSDIVLEEFQGRHAQALRSRLRKPEGGQSEAHLLLGHRLRPDRPEARGRRLRLHDPGHGRPDERHRRTRRHARRRPAEGRRSDRRSHDRHVRGGRACWRHWRGATRPARATTSILPCSTCRRRFSPTRR